MPKSRFLVAFVLIASAVTSQTTWRVQAGAAPPGNGTLATPFPSVQAGINAAINGDTVLVGPGVYSESLNFGGKNITVRSTAGSAATVIDAAHLNRVVQFTSGETPAAMIRGFTLRNGGPIVDGGIFLIVGASPRVEDCVIANGSVSNTGGGICLFAASPSISGCTFLGNSATVEGGAIAVLFNSFPTIVNCSFTANASNQGAAVSLNNASATFEGCTFTSNTAVNDGGAINVSFGNATLVRCSLHSNAATSGGAAKSTFGTLRGTDCRFIQNHALQNGGAVSASLSTVDFANCIFAANTAVNGGAISTDGPSVTITNASIASNVASACCGGIFVVGGNAPTVVNSIVTGNSPNQIAGTTVPPAISITFSNVQGGAPGAGNVSLAPGFVDPANFDFHLSSTSACRNIGTNAAPSLAPTDFDGNPRIVAGTVDLGVDEYVAPLVGSGEDLVLATSVDLTLANVGTKLAPGGSTVGISMTTPNWSFIGATPFIAATGYANASPPAATPGLPQVHIDLASFFLLVDGSQPAALGGSALSALGVGVGFVVPPGLAGLTLRVQGAVASLGAANGLFAMTDAHDLVLQ